MRRRMFGACLLLTAFMLMVAAVESHAQNKKKKPDNDNPASTTIDSDKLRAGEFIGTLKSTPGSDRIFLLEIETPQLVPSGGGGGGGRGGRGNNIMQQQNRLAQAQRAISTARTPQQRMQAMQRYQQAMLQQQRAMSGIGRGGIPGYRVNTIKQEIEFQLSEKARVRTMLLPEEFDDKGNVKKYSARELAQLRGPDSSLPGYSSSLDKLEPGQKVRVILGRVAASGPKADKDADPDAKADKRSQVKTLVILGAASSDSPTGKAKRKNK